MPIGSVRSGILGRGVAIPDSGLKHQYESKEITGSFGTDSNWPDEIASADLTADKVTNQTSNTGSQPTYEEDSNYLQTVPVLSYTDDEIGSDFTTLNAPIRIFAVARLRSASFGRADYLYGNWATGDSVELLASSDSNWGYVDGSGNFVDTGSGLDTDPHLLEIEITGSDSKFLLDETQIGSTNAGGVSLKGLVTGNKYEASTSRRLNANIAAIMVYDTSATGYSTADVRQYLYDRYGDGSSI